MQPSTCHICGFRDCGVGISGRRPDDTRWLCEDCAPLVDQVKAIRRPDAYELKARYGGMNAAAGLIDEFGPDLTEYTEEQALRLCGAIWKGCADELRRMLRDGDAPF